MKYEFKKELKYYTLFIGLVVLFGVFFKAMEGGKVTPYQGYIKNYDGTLTKIAEAAGIIDQTPVQEEPLPGGGLAFKDRFEELCFKIFGKDEYKLMYAIMRAESGADPNKCFISDHEYSCGLFQINIRAHFKKIPGDTYEEKAQWLKFPDNNAIMAKFIKETQGIRAWTVYRTGAFKDFL